MLRKRIDGRDYPNTAKLEIARQLRQHPTPAERHAWALLRRKGILGLKFRRQHPLCGFVVDFYCARLRLILELDGDAHGDHDQSSYDSARTAWLESHGYVVDRVRTRDVGRDALEQMLKTYLPLSRQGEGAGGRGRGGREGAGGKGTGGTSHRGWAEGD